MLEVVVYVVELVGVMLVEVYGIVMFYEMFKFELVGCYFVNICGMMSCAFMGVEELMYYVEYCFGIKVGGIMFDGLILLHYVEC